MDPFPDFGLFEVLAALGIAWLANQIFARPILGFALVALGIAAPVGVIIFADQELTRWLGAGCLATALINAGYIFPQLRRRGSEDESPEPS